MNVGTRKELKTAIRKKRVTVNGEIVRDAGMIVDGSKEVRFDGKIIAYRQFEYYMMNKPAGVLSTTEDSHRTTVLDLMDTERRKDLFPAGRLDIDTEGLLLITNDGSLAHRLLTPRFHVNKIYYAVVLGKLTTEDVRAFANGLEFDKDLTAAPADLKILSAPDAPFAYTDSETTQQVIAPEKYSLAEITIHEGKFHQIKKMFAAVGKEVLCLKRISMGPLKLDPSLAPGEYRPLTEEEVLALKNLSATSV